MFLETSLPKAFLGLVGYLVISISQNNGSLIHSVSLINGWEVPGNGLLLHHGLAYRGIHELLIVVLRLHQHLHAWLASWHWLHRVRHGHYHWLRVRPVGKSVSHRLPNLHAFGLGFALLKLAIRCLGMLWRLDQHHASS